MYRNTTLAAWQERRIVPPRRASRRGNAKTGGIRDVQDALGVEEGKATRAAGAQMQRRNEKRKPEGFLFQFGAGEESRTLDLYLGKVSLYQLSYSRMGLLHLLQQAAEAAWFETGAGEESRTLDLYLGKVSLYQLSYSRMGTYTLLLQEAEAACLESGAGEESRTLDLYLGKVSLYQLSYSRMERFGGGGRDRTGVDGFAGRCITTLLPRLGDTHTT